MLRQRRAPSPLYDLAVAGRRIFWVAACAGIIVFGTLMGAMFIGQQYLQNVLGYSTLDAGLAILPAALLMVVVAPRSAKLVELRSARFTLLVGYLFCLLGFLAMLLLWREDISYWKVGLGYALIGIGVGFAGTPASHSLTGSVPVRRAGMASGTADLQRDLGGAVMQSILGAVLTAGYASAVGNAIAGAPNKEQITNTVQAELEKSFSSATDTAEKYPKYESEIVAAAKSSFLQGDEWAYVAGIVAILLGAALIYFLFPKKEREEELLEQYHAEDISDRAGAGSDRGGNLIGHALAFAPRLAGRIVWDRWIAIGFAVGSVCFFIGPFPGFVDLVGTGADGAVFFAGSIFFTLAALLELRESTLRLGRWAADPSWWSASVQFVGTLLFNLSTFEAMQDGLSTDQESGWCGRRTCSARRPFSSRGSWATARQARARRAPAALSASGGWRS